MPPLMLSMPRLRRALFLLVVVVLPLTWEPGHAGPFTGLHVTNATNTDSLFGTQGETACEAPPSLPYVPSLKPQPAFAADTVAQPSVPEVPDLGARTIEGDWRVQGQEVIENEKLIVNGHVRILSGATLVLRNAVLEVNYPQDSFDPWSSSGLTSIYVESGGGIEFTNSFVVSSRPRAMMVTGEPSSLSIRSSTFSNVESFFHRVSGGGIEDNTFVAPPGQGLSTVLSLANSSGTRISGNTIVSAPGQDLSSANPVGGGISLFFSDHNEVSANSLFGTINGVSLVESSNNTVVGNSWHGPTGLSRLARRGEGGISLLRWSNNNVIEGNTLENAGSAILFVQQSKNNKIASNTLRNAGLALVLRVSSENIITDNSVDYVLEDGIRAYRSYGNVITNNQIHHTGVGISLFSSWENVVGGNVFGKVDRGLYLFDAQENEITGNGVRNSLQSALVVQSAGNTIEQNNFIRSVLPAKEDTNSGVTDVWRANFWKSAPFSVPDSCPASQAWPTGTAPTPEFHPIDFGEVQSHGIEIRDLTVWEGETRTIDGGITIQPGGRLVIRNSKLTFAPGGMEFIIRIEVLPGAALEIDASQIYGPDKDHDLSINVHPDAEIIMTNSELHNAGSWVGTGIGAAIGYKGSSAVIKDNLFENVYSAFSSEPPAANIQFVNNTVTNTIEGVTIIHDARNTTIASNTIRRAAIWGIQIFAGFFPQSVVRENRVNDSWGMGIFDAAGSSAVEPNNTFRRMKGPGVVLLGGSFLDGRQFRPLSLTSTNVRPGQKVSVWFRLMPFFSDANLVRHTPKLTVNGVVIAKKSVSVDYGTTVLVHLAGKAERGGVVGLSVTAFEKRQR